MPEAWREKWQTVGGKAVTLMEAAEQLGVGVFTSGPLGEVRGVVAKRGAGARHVPAAGRRHPHRCLHGAGWLVVEPEPGLVLCTSRHESCR